MAYTIESRTVGTNALLGFNPPAHRVTGEKVRAVTVRPTSTNTVASYMLDQTGQ